LNIRKLFFVVCMSALLVVSGYLVNNVLMDKGLVPKCNIAVHATGTPDSLGNSISSISFWQNGTGSWNIVADAEDFNYTSMVNMSINAQQWTVIKVLAVLNASLASSSSDALSKTAIYINVTGVATNAEPLTGAATLWGGYWHLTWYWTSNPFSPPVTPIWLPTTSSNYTVSVLYRAYY